MTEQKNPDENKPSIHAEFMAEIMEDPANRLREEVAALTAKVAELEAQPHIRWKTWAARDTQMQERVKELERESACPCCRAGVNVEGKPCSECKGGGYISVSYNTLRGMFARLQAELAEARKPVTNEEYAKYFQCDDERGWAAYIEDVDALIAARAPQPAQPKGEE